MILESEKMLLKAKMIPEAEKLITMTGIRC